MSNLSAVMVIVVFYIATNSVGESTPLVSARSTSTFSWPHLNASDVSQPLVDEIQDDNGKGCACEGCSCGCCAHLEVEEFGLNDTVCTNFTYLPDEYGVSLTISVVGKVIYNNTVTVHSPPICVVLMTHLKKYASLCAMLNNLNVTQSQFSGCVRIAAKLEGFSVDKFEIGCFKIQHGSTKVALTKGGNREVNP